MSPVWRQCYTRCARFTCGARDVRDISKVTRNKRAVRHIHVKKWRSSSWFLLHDNVPTHGPVLVKYPLAKNNVTTPEHPPYSPDLSPADFYMFSRLISAMKGRRFCDATDIIKNATIELKIIPQYCFQECFQHLCSRWKKCIVVQDDCSLND
jgi:hypothetical protein